MSYINSENKIIKLIDNFPEKMVKSGDYDIVYLIVKISELYDLSYDEIEKIYDEIFDILTGKKEATFLEKRIREVVSPNNQQNAHKITFEIEDKIINPIKKALGNNFPIRMEEKGVENATKPEFKPFLSQTSSVKENDGENITRDNLLKEIENPRPTNLNNFHLVPPRKDPFPNQVEIRPETLPTTQPSPAESIIEKKMNSITSLPKVEAEVKIEKKNYTNDPYREAV